MNRLPLVPFGPFTAMLVAYIAARVAGVPKSKRSKWVAGGAAIGVSASLVNWATSPPLELEGQTVRMIPFGPVQGIITAWAIAELSGATAKRKRQGVIAAAAAGTGALVYNYRVGARALADLR